MGDPQRNAAPLIGTLQDSILFQYAMVYFYILWTLCKFFFYILPISDLIKIKNYDGKSADIVITYMITIPVFEFVAYYYVVTRIIEKILAQERGEGGGHRVSCPAKSMALWPES